MKQIIFTHQYFMHFIKSWDAMKDYMSVSRSFGLLQLHSQNRASCDTSVDIL